MAMAGYQRKPLRGPFDEITQRSEEMNSPHLVAPAMDEMPVAGSSNLVTPPDAEQSRSSMLAQLLARAGEARAASGQKRLQESEVTPEEQKKAADYERFTTLLSSLQSASNKIGGQDSSAYQKNMAAMGAAPGQELKERQLAGLQAQKDIEGGLAMQAEAEEMPTKTALREQGLATQKQLAEERGYEIQGKKMALSDKEAMQKMAQESNDPNSQTSVEARKFYSEILKQPMPDTMSASKLQSISKDLFDVFQTREAARLKHAELATTRQIAAGERTAKKETEGKNREFEQTTKLAGKYGDEQVVKTAQEVQRSYQNIVKAPKTAQGDIQRIYGIAKIYDPGSAVREGEIHLNQSAAAVLENMGIKVRNIGAGMFGIEKQLLSETQRGQIEESARSIVDQSNEKLADINKKYEEDASYYGLKPERIITARPTQSAAKTPQGGGSIFDQELEKRNLQKRTGAK